MHTLIHSQRCTPPFSMITLNILEPLTEMEQTSRCCLSENSRSFDHRRAQHWKKCSKDVGHPHSPSLLQCVMNTGPVSCWEKRGPLLPHKHSPTHTYTLEQIFHTCWLQPSRPFNSIFSPGTHTYTMKLIDYFSKISWVLVM